MIARLRRAAARPDGDEGLTLAETVVTMAVGSLLMALVTVFTVQQLRTVDYAEERATAGAQMASAQDAIGKRLRTMLLVNSDNTALRQPPLPGGAPGPEIDGPVAAGPEVLGFYTYLSNTPNAPATEALRVQEVWVWVRTATDGKRTLCEQTRVRERSIDPFVLLPASPAVDLSAVQNRTCRVLVERLAPYDATRPLFSYVTDAYDPLAGPPRAVVAAGQDAEVVADPVADASQLRAVRVNLRARASTGHRTTVLESTSTTQLLNKIGRTS
ncbi:hypothetical protein GCM10027586_01370 [Kineococcus gypseus]|uniref:PulJ/GspJ family protein n=1 Tax=Kineococcus gypseus TaxID=1637102 RepID=UPI003D7D2933